MVTKCLFVSKLLISKQHFNWEGALENIQIAKSSPYELGNATIIIVSSNSLTSYIMISFIYMVMNNSCCRIFSFLMLLQWNVHICIDITYSNTQTTYTSDSVLYYSVLLPKARPCCSRHFIKIKKTVSCPESFHLFSWSLHAEEVEQKVTLNHRLWSLFWKYSLVSSACSMF